MLDAIARRYLRVGAACTKTDNLVSLAPCNPMDHAVCATPLASSQSPTREGTAGSGTHAHLW